MPAAREPTDPADRALRPRPGRRPFPALRGAARDDRGARRGGRPRGARGGGRGALLGALRGGLPGLRGGGGLRPRDAAARPDGPPARLARRFRGAPRGRGPAGRVGAPAPAARWEPALDEAGHARALGRIHEHIARGDTYQVNFTFPSARAARRASRWASSRGSSRAAAPPRALRGPRPIRRSGICSASPELFFRGTARRSPPGR